MVREEVLRFSARLLLSTRVCRLSPIICNIALTYSSTAYFCMKHNLHASLISPASLLKLPRRIVDPLIGRFSFWLGGLFAGLSLFIEAKHRRPELAMYVLPKGLESVWKMALGKGIVHGPAKYGESLVCFQLPPQPARFCWV